MHVVVYGLGAVGGSIAAALASKRHEVTGIARGAHLTAIQENGLRFRGPGFDDRVAVRAVSDPSQISFGPDDLILLAMKSQDTQAALEALRLAGVKDQPIFCLQNGVANERMALRLFPNVHGATVMMPSTHLEPGEVAVFGEPRYGIFDLGRFPSGCDHADQMLGDLLDDACFAGFPMPDVMARKYGKLLMNLGNILKAALGKSADTKDLHDRLKAEAIAVYKAAGIDWCNVGSADPRRDQLLRFVDVPGLVRGLGSTTQSLARGMPLETDYLNGEIALLGRLHDVPTPLNSGLTRLAAQMSAQSAAPGSLSMDELIKAIGA